MSLRTKIVLFNAFVLALAFLAAGAALLSYARAIAPLRRAVSDEAQSVQLADALRRQMDSEASTVTQALAQGDVASARAYEGANRRFDDLLAQASALAVDARARAALEEARAGEAVFNARAEEALSQARDPSTALRLVAGSVLPARDEADVALDHFLDRQQAATRAAEREASRAALTAVTTFVAFLAIAGTAAAFSSLTLSRHVLDRLAALGRATEAVAGGERAVLVPTGEQGGDELDQLARAFNAMVFRLAAAEAAARRADEMKASFLASVSHDLRTPITTVKGLLETLRRDDAQWDEASRREFLDVAARESERLARLVQNLLDLSRLEAGSWPVHREAVDLPALARSVAGDLSVAGGPLEGRPVRVVAAATQAAWADEDQMVRVLYNLLTNAAKFSPPGTAVEVRVEDAPASSNRAATFAADVQPGVMVEVIDSGPGVAAADRGHVFNKFFRAGATRSTAPGTGLGLAICRGIVEAHGGHIWVQPGPGGRGACFSFAVPAAPPPAPRPATGGEQGTPAVGRRVKEAATV